jgi:hypothetical protein
MSKHKARKRFGQNFLTDNSVIEAVKAVSAGTLPTRFSPCLLSFSIKGLMISISSEPKYPSSPA